MRKSAAMLCLLAVFALAACGGGNNTSSNSSGDNSSSSDNSSEAKEKTPAEKRQAVVDAMVKAFSDLDIEALKALWVVEERDVVEKRMGKEFTDLKEAGGSWTAKPGDIEEKDGHFILPVEFTITSPKREKPEADNHEVELMEQDGKWMLKFGSK